MDLCFFAFLVIPDSSLAPWKCLCGHCWIPGWILGLELENKKGFVQPPVAPSLWNSPCWGWWPWGVCPKPWAAPGGLSCGSCGLWLQIWGILAPQDVAAPWDTSRICRRCCGKLLLRLVLPWSVGTALELSWSWFIPGNPGCSCPPCGAEGWEFPGLTSSSQGSPVGSQSCSWYFSLPLGCVSCVNIPVRSSLTRATWGIPCRNPQ